MKYYENVKRELQQYVYDNLFPIYATFDKGHDVAHIEAVLRRSFWIFDTCAPCVDPNMVFAVAAYHDIGMKVARENHAMHSGKIVREERNLSKWFSVEQIEIIAQAVEDHSTSSQKTPRSIYGKIVCDADKDDDYKVSLLRAWEFVKNRFPQLTDEECRENVYQQLQKKFGKDGLVKYWLIDIRNSDSPFLKIMKAMATNRAYFEMVLSSVLEE